MITRSIVGIALLVALGLPVGATTGNISGNVHNSTSDRPAVGDDVILLRLGNGMEEESRTRTDNEGAFTLHESSATAQYVVRVMHQGVNYDHTVIGTGPVDIEVFDSVSRIQGLSGKIGIAQVESDGRVLKVTEMYAIDNASVPPVTQSGPQNFEIFLPERATFDSVEASRGNGIWIKTPPTPVKDRPGRYAVNFPLRPGATLIKFTYHLPYTGSTIFHLKLSYPIKKFAVMHPPSMVFKAARPGTFTNPGKANGLEVEAAARQPLVGDVPAFEISGAGVVAPAATAALAVPAPFAASVTTGAGNSARGQPVRPGATSSAGPMQGSWIVVLATAGLLTLGALVFWWRRKIPPAATVGTPLLRDYLKEELFQLEVDRARGAISADEYAALKQGLSQTLKRAIGRRKR